MRAPGWVLRVLESGDRGGGWRGRGRGGFWSWVRGETKLERKKGLGVGRSLWVGSERSGARASEWKNGGWGGVLRKSRALELTAEGIRSGAGEGCELEPRLPGQQGEGPSVKWVMERC